MFKRKNEKKILAVLILGLAIRVAFVWVRPISLDEGISILFAKTSLGVMIKGTMADVHPPLYFVLLNLWAKINQSLIFLRFLSLILGMMVVWAMFFVGGSLFNRRVGILSGLLAALSPVYIFESVNLRMYSLAILESIFVVYFFLRLSRENKIGDYLWLGLVLVLGIYTHYYFLVVWLVLNLFFIFKVSSFRSILKRWLRLQGLVLLFCVPLVWYFMKAEHPQIFPTFHFLLKIPGAFATFVVSWDAVQILKIYPFDTLSLLRVVFAAVVFSLWVLFFSGFKTLMKQKEKFGFFLVYLFVPVILVYIVSSLFKPIFGMRSFIIFSPVFYFTVALGLERIGKGRQRNLVMGVLVFMIGMFLVLEWTGFRKNPDVCSVYNFVQDNSRPLDIYLHTEPFTLILGRFCMGDVDHYAVVPTWLSEETQVAIGYHNVDIEKLLEREGRFWFFYSDFQFFNRKLAEEMKSELEEKQTVVLSEYFDEWKMNVSVLEKLQGGE